MDKGDDVLVAAFYCFVPLPDFRSLREPIRLLGENCSLKGTILLASEGINATVAGAPGSVRKFIGQLEKMGPWERFDCKFSYCSAVPFRRWRVRLKKEIVTLKAKATPHEKVGHYVQPEDWNQVLADPDVLVIDVRNTYEIEYGSFKNALNPMTEDFCEFPSYVLNQLHEPDRPIALFCTGGIRCEKATSYLLDHGFSNVMHLRGGILNYLDKVPGAKSQWQGSCFVFDEREALDHELRPIRV